MRQNRIGPGVAKSKPTVKATLRDTPSSSCKSIPVIRPSGNTRVGASGNEASKTSHTTERNPSQRRHIIGCPATQLGAPIRKGTELGQAAVTPVASDPIRFGALR